jgi:acyl-CoA synthetase (AMP-forming)/AMP-acid ligase II
VEEDVVAQVAQVQVSSTWVMSFMRQRSMMNAPLQGLPVRHFTVAKSTVIGIPDSQRDQVLKAYVVLKANEEGSP